MAVHKDRITELEVGDYIDVKKVNWAPWLAAILTLKGTIGNNPIPFIRIIDNLHTNRIKAISGIYPNSSSQDGVYHTSMYFQNIMNLCSSFMPYLEGDTTIERYLELMEVESYVAGLADWATFIHKKDKDRCRGLRMILRTTEKNLLLAGQSVFRGSIRCDRKVGEKIKIGESENVAKSDVWAWELGHRDTLKLLRYGNHFLQVANISALAILYDHRACKRR